MLPNNSTKLRMPWCFGQLSLNLATDKTPVTNNKVQMKKKSTTDTLCISFSLGCSLDEHGHLVWYPAKVKVDFLQESDKDWYANISWTPLAGMNTLINIVSYMVISLTEAVHKCIRVSF